ncbi:MAG: Gfo/Idh/MocA family oxidoreductase [Candidatus Brocadiae bacterium]|nr:Gfo/Idh/MocA family oxidoreductase [Candidatus Brocadiia bacterium]
MSRPRLSRREFIGGSVAAGAAMLLPGRLALGANEELRVAVVGLGGKGSQHVDEFAKIKGVRVAAVSDIDTVRLDGSGAVKKLPGKVTRHQDFRRILDDKNIDVMVFATPNHWHAMQTILACQAGKDVYVEKPISHSIWEGRKAIEAARKYNRIVQSGTQQRSDPGVIEAAADLKAGKLGKVKWVHSIWYKRRGPIGKTTKPTALADTINYDLWCGPAPKPRLMRARLHYDWHWFWDYGNGDMGNLMTHLTDDVRHLLDWDDVPQRIMSVGGRFGWDDDGETPNTHFAVMMRGGLPVIVGFRSLPFSKTKKATAVYRRFGKGLRFTNLVKCEGGFYTVTRGGGYAYDNDGKKIKQYDGDGGRGHTANLIKAVRSRKVGDLNADVELGHYSAIMCHMANISHRIGTGATADEIGDRLEGCEEGLETLKQAVKHLGANEIDLAKQKPTLGPWLTYDFKAERFTGDMADKANALVKGTYRAPFVVPDTV